MALMLPARHSTSALLAIKKQSGIYPSSKRDVERLRVVKSRRGRASERLKL